jgi:predicted DNA-binding transcriptional regulator YafY
MNLASLNRWHRTIQLLETRPRTKAELIDRLEDEDYKVSARTLERDLADITQALGLPISYNRAKGYYQLGKAGPEGNQEDMGDVQQKLQLISRLAQSGDVATQLVKFAQKSCLRLDPIQPKVGTEYLQPLLDAADARRAVQLTYQSFDRPAPQQYTFEPVLLTEYAARWYACGYYVEKKETRVFALDRIQNLVPLATPAVGPYAQEHFRGLLEDVIGITLSTDKQAVQVTLKATPKQVRYLQSVPLHPSQRIDGDLVQLHIRPNVEFYQTVIALGKEIEVVGPAAVRQEVARQLKEALAVYG